MFSLLARPCTWLTLAAFTAVSQSTNVPDAVRTVAIDLLDAGREIATVVHLIMIDIADISHIYPPFSRYRRRLWTRISSQSIQCERVPHVRLPHHPRLFSD